MDTDNKPLFTEPDAHLTGTETQGAEALQNMGDAADTRGLNFTEILVAGFNNARQAAGKQATELYSRLRNTAGQEYEITEKTLPEVLRNDNPGNYIARLKEGVGGHKTEAIVVTVAGLLLCVAAIRHKEKDNDEKDKDSEQKD